jgi:hypothetical protein
LKVDCTPPNNPNFQLLILQPTNCRLAVLWKMELPDMGHAMCFYKTQQQLVFFSTFQEALHPSKNHTNRFGEFSEPQQFEVSPMAVFQIQQPSTKPESVAPSQL